MNSLLNPFLIEHFDEEDRKMIKNNLSEGGRWLGEQLVGRMDEQTYKPIEDAYNLIAYYQGKGRLNGMDVELLKMVAEKVFDLKNDSSQRK